MGASILPITVCDGKILFLFGKERSIDENPGWSDFGGGTDNDESYIETASREGAEELTGFLGEKNNIKQLLAKHGTFNIDYDSGDKYGTYRCHICPVDYDEYLTMYYNNNQRFLQKHLNKNVIRDTKIFEKVEIKWFSFEDIRRNKSHFRKFYQNIVDLILENKPQIEEFIKMKNKKNKKNNKRKTQRRSNKRRSNKRRSNKRRSNKQRSNKRRSNKR